MIIKQDAIDKAIENASNIIGVNFKELLCDKDKLKFIILIDKLSKTCQNDKRFMRHWFHTTCLKFDKKPVDLVFEETGIATLIEYIDRFTNK